ncbi:FAD/NAD(P)-binding protein, partial [Nocardioides hankookensis]
MVVTDRAPVHAGADARSDRIAIIGGGASGVLTALQLLSTSTDSALRVTVHEATGVLGRGIAYCTSDPRHLLNVRARHMSAYADVPSDLLDWARRAGRDPDPLGFLPRMEYSAYLQDTLADVADHRLTISAGRVDDVVPV